MIEFHYAPTPNGWKVAIMLEECGLAYETRLMRLSEGDQFQPGFLAISPNAKMPAIVDRDPPAVDGPEPVTVFESGAILLVPRGEDRAASWTPTDPLGRKATARVAVLADRQSRPHGRPAQSLRQLRPAGSGRVTHTMRYQR